ncbi:MAG: hypothetical protein HOV81_37655 [Kofleriaceae bacterium]|nr:hypothetical protein [Kofleriaceae bacterium]
MKRALLLLTIAACADVPASPTYFTDVQPILRANCARCHGGDPIEPTVAKYRLDRYVKDDATTLDAYDYAASIVDHTVAHVAPAMPPDYALTDRQQEILTRWLANGAPKGTRDNHTPQIQLIAPTDVPTADQSIDTTFRSWDDDLDGLVVQLWAHDLMTDEDLPLGMQVGGGLRSVAIDSGTLASKHDFEIYAILDDGYADDPTQNKTRATLIPRVSIDHGARGTAPSVTLVAPNDGGTLIGAVPITWTAVDPDVDGGGAPDTLTIDLALVRYAADATTEVSTESIATDLPNTGAFTWNIPATLAASDASGPIPYRIRVTATDSLGVPPNIRSDDSDVPFFVEQPVATTITWADVKPLFVQYCADCHGQPAQSPALDPYCFVEYEKGEAVPPCEVDDVGVFEKRTDVFTRVVTQANMPPNSAPKPTQAERDKIKAWLLGGAPYGNGPTDARPTLTWTAPGSATLDGTSGAAMLAWTIGDAEGLAGDVIQFVKVNGPPTCNLTQTCPSLTASTSDATWAANEVTRSMQSGSTQTRTFSWPRPASGSGCYCVRGSVTDTANQTTTVVANKPVRF